MTCDFGVNEEGHAVIGDISMLSYQFICAAETGNDCNCTDKEFNYPDTLTVKDVTNESEIAKTEDQVDKGEGSEAEKVLWYIVVGLVIAVLICVTCIFCNYCILKKYLAKYLPENRKFR